MQKQRHNKIHISCFPIEVNVWKSDHGSVSLTYLHSWSWFPGDPVSAGTYWPVDLPSIDECPHWLCCCVRGLKFLDCECCSVMYNKNLAWIFDLMFLLLYKHKGEFWGLMYMDREGNYQSFWYCRHRLIGQLVVP